MRLQTKILGSLIPFIILPILLVGMLAYQHLYATAIHNARDQLHTLIHQIDSKINDHIERANKNLSLLASNPLVTDYVLAEEEQRYTLMHRPLIKLFNNYQLSFPEYFELRIILPDGYEDLRTVSEKLENQSDDASNSEIFKQLTDSERFKANDISTVSLMALHSDTHKPALFTGRRITLVPKSSALGAKPELKAILVISQDAGFLQKLTNLDTIENQPDLFVTNAEGEIFFSSDNSDRNLATKVARSFIRNKIFDDLTEINLNETPHLAIVHQVSDQVFLTGLLPQSTLTESAKDLNEIVLMLTLGIILLTAFTLHFTIRIFVTSPLGKLNSLTKAIADGNLDINIDIVQQDEVGDLAKSFSDMRLSLKESTQQIEELAYYDTLTGLPNKITFLDRIQQQIHEAKTHERMLGVLFFDLDNFKNVNDGLGHQMGDLLLMQVGTRLRDCTRGSDHIELLNSSFSTMPRSADTHVLARMGGDEFTLLLPDIHSPEETSKVAVRILTKLAMPFILNDHEVFIGASIGIAIYPADGESSETLLKHADIAMYEAKSRGKNNFQFFDHAMNAPVSERLSLESKMRAAFENDEFRLYYQPRVPVDGKIRYEFEALIRWINPERGFISPAVFIPIAEESGLIQQVGEWVLDKACKQIKTWLDMGYSDVLVSINLSPVQFNYGNPASSVRSALKKYNIEPKHLEVEITETGLMQNENIATTILLALKDLGVRIALDDFGTGYSSLAYLRRFPINTLKIDRSFIHDLEQDPESILVLESIISLARSLELEIVAEGVETLEQLEILKARKCDSIQGFYFAKPTPPNEAMTFFDQYFEEWQRLQTSKN